MTGTTTDRNLVWILLAIVTALVALPMLMMSVGMMGMGPMMGGAFEHGMWGWTDGGAGWMPLVGVGLQLLFLGLLVGAGYLGYRALSRPADSTDSALAELRTAYARGEFDDEEFERRRERLQAER